MTGDGSVTARLDAQERANDYTKSGVVIRNDLTAARSGTGYASLYRLAGFGVALAVDTNGDGIQNEGDHFFLCPLIGPGYEPVMT